jgi:hypothetical protein
MIRERESKKYQRNKENNIPFRDIKSKSLPLLIIK